MIYTMEQIEKLYSSLQNTKEIARIKEIKEIKGITKSGKVGSEIRVITYWFWYHMSGLLVST